MDITERFREFSEKRYPSGEPREMAWVWVPIVLLAVFLLVMVPFTIAEPAAVFGLILLIVRLAVIAVILATFALAVMQTFSGRFRVALNNLIVVVVGVAILALL